MFRRHPLLSLLTSAYLVFVAWLTLTPHPIGTGQQDLLLRLLDGLHRRGYAGSLDFDRAEFLANIALFVPIGMFLLLLFGASGWWAAVLVPIAMTGGIEYAQHYIPDRVPDRRDLVANTSGALIGVVLALVLTAPSTLRRRAERLRQP
jgi:VanZ family protein